ncbi:MAG: homoserine dehydrogenase [Candidatus Margulisiibacteriota bacterium]
MAKQINIGIIGLGNIGSAVASNIRKNHSVILDNTGIDIKVKKVCDVRRIKTPYPFTLNPMEIIKDPNISVVVEAIGGVNPALKFILAALNNGKSVVTPNKEVIAKHMKEIFAAARKNRVQVMFEGAVGGGIPIIQPLRESLAGNKIEQVYGIVNGTTNYILSKMMEEQMEFGQALKKAQEKGYAEPDPTADIKGYDACYKAAILASVAFGAEVNWKDVHFEGITRITQEDIQYARDIGYVIKLLAIAKKVDNKLEVRVHPALIGRTHPLASVSENFNAIYVKGDPMGQLMFYGPGAGGGPTASAIISDIIAIANDKCQMTNVKLRSYPIKRIDEIESRYYIRLQVPDKSGVLAGISKAFARKKVSIAAVVQKETVGDLATLVVLLHQVSEKNLKAALKVIEKLPVVRKVCNVIRIVS